jgi:hypothetical protein
MSREFGAVQQDASRAPQTPDRSALGVGEAVIGLPPCIVQLVASRQRQPAAGRRIDILRVHGFLQLQSDGKFVLPHASRSIRQAPHKFRECIEHPGSDRTPRWREMDSNHRYRVRNNPFWLPPFGPAIRLPQQKPALSCRGPMVRIHLPPATSLAQGRTQAL